MPFLAVVLVLVEAGAAAVFFVVGPWLCGAFMAVAALCTLVILWEVRRAVKRSQRPAQTGYVERETVGY